MEVNTKASEQIATDRDLSSLSAKDHKIVSLLIECPWFTDEEIGEKVGLSRQSVNRRKNSDVVKNLLRSALAIPEKEFRRLSSKALRRLEALLDHEDPKVKLAAAAALLKVSTPALSNAFFQFDALQTLYRGQRQHHSLVGERLVELATAAKVAENRAWENLSPDK